MPVWVWWLGMPFMIWVSGSAFFLIPGSNRFQTFMYSFLVGMIWPIFAPYPRYLAALWTGFFTATPCFCLGLLLAGQGPTSESYTSVALLFAGAIVPVVAYVVIDRKDIKWL
ncbi:MAG: hypothetical protein WCG75_12530 [Armatimonadota bacterium]